MENYKNDFWGDAKEKYRNHMYETFQVVGPHICIPLKTLTEQAIS